MAYEEYDYYNEPSTGSLKDSLYQILHGLQNPQHLRETGEGIGRVRQALPGVTESVARGAIAAVPGVVGDVSDFARTYAPEVMEKKFGKERFFPTTREILDYVPRMTPTHEGATTLEDVGAAISPGVGGVARDIAIPTAKAYGRYVGPTAYKHLEDYLIKTGGIQQMMTGPESKLWNKEMAFNAGKMEAKGETPEQIFKKTGMVRGLDQQWRSEISDQFATMKGSGTFGETVMDRMVLLGKDKTAEPVTLNDVFYHSKLAESYPELMNTEVQFTKKGSKNKGELVHTEDGYVIRVNPDMPAEKAVSTILHEVQHAIQGEEGWNRGANYGEQVKYYVDQQKKLMSEIEDLNRQGSVAYKADDMDKYRQLMQSRDVLSKRYGQIDPEKMGYEDYLLHGGEAESRLTQNRMKLSDEGRRQQFPYQYAPEKYGLDINPDDAIISTQHPRSINTPTEEFEYRGSHTAPYRTEDGVTAPGYEMNRTFPDDVYSPEGYRYYGHGGDAVKMDKETMAIMQKAKGNPDQPITIYRAVPKEFADEDIYTGDWITPNINYAKEHGRRFDDGYHIIEKTVPAKHIWTDGNSIHEFGYDPTE
jgi:hypothetical protein